jgi:hypothetical protein
MEFPMVMGSQLKVRTAGGGGPVGEGATVVGDDTASVAVGLGVMTAIGVALAVGEVGDGLPLPMAMALAIGVAVAITGGGVGDVVTPFVPRRTRYPAAPRMATAATSPTMLAMPAPRSLGRSAWRIIVPRTGSCGHPSGSPQLRQKRAFGSLSMPQLGHWMTGGTP